jgi:hypothetical protein
MQMIPHFCGHEEVAARDFAVALAQEIRNGGADFVLVAVEPGAVQMPVSRAQGMQDGTVGLAGRAFAGKGAKTKAGDF